MNVVILGATETPDRFAFRAQKMLMDHGFETIPISLRGDDVLGKIGYVSVSEIPDESCPIDTVTVYVNPTRFEPLIDEIIELSPTRVIFNPGTESSAAMKKLSDAGIHVVEACTLILLQDGEFESA
ncbi:MAG: CoA-binding protein [Verrucomicrobiales bacterium]